MQFLVSPQKRVCVLKVFSQEFLRKRNAIIDSARSAWSNKSLMALLYFYSINPNPTEMISFILVSIFATVFSDQLAGSN